MKHRRFKLLGMGLPAWLLCAFAVSILTPRMLVWYRVLPFGLALCFWASTGQTFLRALRHRLVWLPTLYVAMGFAYRFLGFSSASWGNYGRFLTMFVAYWAGFYAWNCLKSSERQKVFVIVFWTLVVNLLDQFRLYLLHPGLKAYFAKIEIGRYGSGQMMNLGLTNFICSIMVFALFLLANLLNGRPDNPKWKLVLHGSLVALSAFYFMAYAQSATITLCFLFTAVLFWVCGNEKPSSKGLLLKLIGTGCGLFLFVVFAPSILSWSREALEPVAGSKLLARLQTIQHLSENRLDSNDLFVLSRGSLILMDLDNWLSSLSAFFVGNGYHFTNSFGLMERAELSGAGDHSGYMDILPRYGLLGFVAFVAMSVFLWKYFLDGCDKRCAVKLRIFLLMLIFYNVANKLFHANVIFSIMFLLPFLRQKPGPGSLPSRQIWRGNAVTARPGGKPMPTAPSLLPLTKEKR